MQRGAPVIVLNQNTKRESGRKVTIGNISASKAIADVIRTSLGPRAMLKMLMDPMGGIVMTNDGNAILREITVKHPAAKSMIEISRTQDEEVGDGTTSVIVLAGEVMACAEPFLEQGMHPTVIIQAYRAALEDIIQLCNEKFSLPIDITQDAEIAKVVKSCLGTKMMSRWMDMAVNISMKAIKTVAMDENGKIGDVDMKRYVRMEKVPGGAVEDTSVVMGIVLNKDVVHAKMRRRVEKPRCVLMDCNLEYKKGESQTSMELSKDTDFTKVLQLEEDAIRKMCDSIIALKPDVVFTEKGISDLAQHFLVRAGITAIRRLKKTDNNRLARVCGARIVSDPDELRPDDVGTLADLFEIKKIGDEYFTFVTSAKARACTILVRGPSKDVMNEMERNLRDSQCVVRNLLQQPRICPGGGAIEMALSVALNERSKSVPGIRQWPYKALARALEVLPRTLIQNCGGSVVRQMTALRAKHAGSADCWTFGVDGCSGSLVDMNKLDVWDPLGVKLQVYKTAVETAVMLLRIDDILSGTKKADGSGATEQKPINPDQEMSGPGIN